MTAGRKTMPGAMPAELAEKLSDIGDEDETLRQRALDDLVDRIMDFEEYPRRAMGQQINLLDILIDCDHNWLAQAVWRELKDGPTLSLDIPKLVRAYLEDSEWLALRIAEMQQEDKEAE